MKPPAKNRRVRTWCASNRGKGAQAHNKVKVFNVLHHGKRYVQVR
jgi:hypothetical protein